jgi:Flp pilus assembly protein TadB
MKNVSEDAKADYAGETRPAFGRETAQRLGKQIQRAVEDVVEDVKDTVAAQLEDGKFQAERLLKKGRYAVEDRIEEVSHNVKRNVKRDPLRFLAIAFGAGAALGFLAVHLLTPRTTKG